MKILIVSHFLKQLKKLKKKFPGVKADLIFALESFDEREALKIGKSIFKLRVRSRDLNRGKDGAFRAYIYFYRKRDLLVPVCMFAKNERIDVSEKELDLHLRRVLIDLVTFPS